MRKAAYALALCVATAVLIASARPVLEAQAKPPVPALPKPVADMKELMVDLIYPTSDALFYVARGEPKDEAEWLRLQLNALTLAESANLLMMPGRVRNQEQWTKDAQLLWDVGMKAYRAAKARNHQALVDLNDELYESCQSCHVNYRPGYQRRP